MACSSCVLFLTSKTFGGHFLTASVSLNAVCSLSHLRGAFSMGKVVLWVVPLWPVKPVLIALSWWAPATGASSSVLVHILLCWGGKLCLGFLMFSFRLLPPLHVLPRWARFLTPVFVAAGFFGLSFRDRPAFGFLPLPRFRCGLCLIRERFLMGVVHRPVRVSIFLFRSGTADINLVQFSSTVDLTPGEWLGSILILCINWLSARALLPGISTILFQGRARLSVFGVVVCSVPYPRLAVPPEILLPEEVELLRAGHALLLGERVFGVVVCSVPYPRLAVPPEISLPEEVELLRAGHALLLDERL